MCVLLSCRSFLTALASGAVPLAPGATPTVWAHGRRARLAASAAARYRIGVESYCFHAVDLTAIDRLLATAPRG